MKIGLGRLAYYGYYAPVGWAQELYRDGGPWQRRLTELGRREMVAAAEQLPPAPAESSERFTVHLLTGKRFWYQTAFCLWSLAKASGRTVCPIFLDDGTLDDDSASALQRILPETKIITAAQIVERLDRVLPPDRFPSLRARRLVYPHLRKLIDLHAGLAGWRILIDSDLLFFHSPEVLLRWHDNPHLPLRAEDIGNAYGYPLSLLNELAGQVVPERVNCGMLGLRSEEIDWDKLEYWCHELLARVGPHYYQEQALVAMLLAGRECVVPPLEDYLVWPKPPEALACRAVMHHYVANSKRWYFQYNWRRFAAPGTTLPL